MCSTSSSSNSAPLTVVHETKSSESPSWEKPPFDIAIIARFLGNFYYCHLCQSRPQPPYTWLLLNVATWNPIISQKQLLLALFTLKSFTACEIHSVWCSCRAPHIFVTPMSSKRKVHWQQHTEYIGPRSCSAWGCLDATQSTQKRINLTRTEAFSAQEFSAQPKQLGAK